MTETGSGFWRCAGCGANWAYGTWKADPCGRCACTEGTRMSAEQKALHEALARVQTFLDGDTATPRRDDVAKLVAVLKARPDVLVA